MEILKVENLCKTYGKGNNQVQALNDVSFSVEKGEFVAIVGQSGSGKSTLLHLIGGVDKPTSGHIFVDGQDVYKKNKEQILKKQKRSFPTDTNVLIAEWKIRWKARGFT